MTRWQRLLGNILAKSLQLFDIRQIRPNLILAFADGRSDGQTLKKQPVMVPSIYGMSQFADGGSFTTKPHFSGSNYLCKMSDEAKGPWCRVWDGLFWSFIADHGAFFPRNPRLSMMVRIWHQPAPEKQALHLEAAAEFPAGLDGCA